MQLSLYGNKLSLYGNILALYTDAGPVAPPRGDDAFRSAGERERFWQRKAEAELQDLLDRVEAVVRKPVAARMAVVEDFALVEWEDLPIAPKTREMLAKLDDPQPDYTGIVALVLIQRQEIRLARKRRDEDALMQIMGWTA
jgi:hypothetical protein